jgi:hypothetical protein
VASFLDGMAGSIYAGFKGKLRAGVIRRMGAGTGLDGHGRPQNAAPIFHKMEGFDDDYSAFRRANEGIALTSLRINIFGASIDPPLPDKPTKDMLVRLDYPAANGQAAYSRWFKLKERIETDPARALWQCEAQDAKAPNDGD